jgi:hypothetical protein
MADGLWAGTRGGGGSCYKSIQSADHITSGVDTFQVTISAVDVSKSYIYTEIVETTGSADSDNNYYMVKFIDSTTIEFSRAAAGSGSSTLRYTVIEFNDVESIQFVEGDMNNIATLDIAVSAVDLAKTFLHTSYRYGQSGTNARCYITARMTTSTNCRIIADFQSTGDKLTGVFIIEAK